MIQKDKAGVVPSFNCLPVFVFLFVGLIMKVMCVVEQDPGV